MEGRRGELVRVRDVYGLVDGWMDVCSVKCKG
jgi:hypothetical protein